jgi:hypothetical protein
MRTVKLSVPPDRTAAVLEIAFAAGIESATVHKAEVHAKDAKSVQREVIDLDISTPKAKAFLDRLLASEVYDRDSFSIVIKQPRSIVSRSDEQELTEPLEEPGVDLLAELWQFSHITYGLVGRILISAILLAHGLIEQNILFIVAGLLFLPVLPMLMAISLGALTRRWRLAAQGIGALLIAIALLFTGGAVAAALSGPPLRYNEFGTLLTSLAISTAVGIAAGLSTIDDAGRRELIGLAAASQIGIIPAWLGASAILGLPSTAPEGQVGHLMATVFGSVVVIVIAVAAVQIFSGVVKGVTAPPPR